MKLEECKKGLLARVIDKTVWGRTDTNGKLFPALERGWGYIQFTSCNDSVFLSKTLSDLAGEPGAYSPNDLEPYESEETEYRQLKDITPRAIYDKQFELCGGVGSCFMQEFTRFVAMFNVRYLDVIPFEDLVDELEVEPGWEKWLIQHGFIEKVVEKPEEITYTYGNKLVNDEGKTGVIVQVGARQVCIIYNNNRWVEPISVSSVTRITAEEFKTMQGDLGTWRKDK